MNRTDACAFLVLSCLSLGIGTVVDGVRKTFEIMPAKRVESAHELSFEQFRDRVQAKSGLILDARSREDFRMGHVPGALAFPASYFEGSYLRLGQKLGADKSQPIVIYCVDAECGSADSVRRKLANQGFTRLAVFRGGWQAWQKAALPEETGE